MNPILEALAPTSAPSFARCDQSDHNAAYAFALHQSQISRMSSNANRIRVAMRMSVNPYRQQYQKHHNKTIDMEAEDFHALFPNSKAFKAKKSAVPRDGKSRLRTTHQARFKSPKELEALLGVDWYITRYKNCVGLFVGELIFSLKKKLIHNFATEISNNQETVDQATSCVETLTYLHVSFMFVRYSYSNRADCSLWRQQADRMMNDSRITERPRRRTPRNKQVNKQ